MERRWCDVLFATFGVTNNFNYIFGKRIDVFLSLCVRFKIINSDIFLPFLSFDAIMYWIKLIFCEFQQKQENNLSSNKSKLPAFHETKWKILFQWTVCCKAWNGYFKYVSIWLHVSSCLINFHTMIYLEIKSILFLTLSLPL